MTISDIKQWIVSEDKLAKPANPFDYDSAVEYTAYERFATFSQQHTYATDLEPGIYDVDKVEVVWQYKSKLDEWFNAPSIRYDEYQTFNDYKEDSKIGYDVDTRKFLRLKQQPKELNVCPTCKGVSSKYCSNAFHLVNPLNHNATAIKVINKEIERLAELRETYLNGTQWDNLTNQLQILKRILKLLQS